MIYAFLGSLFDPECEDVDHVEALQKMEAIERDVALSLMHNMAANIQSSQVWLFTPYHTGVSDAGLR